MDHLSPHHPSSIHVLMTGAGAPGGPGIIKALQAAGYQLTVGDANAIASGRFLNPSFIQLPEADAPDFIDFILKFCIANGIHIVFPLVTKELFKFAANKQLFLRHGIKIIVSDYESLCIANDKSKLYNHLHERGITVPVFRVVKNLPEFTDAVEALGYPAKAVCVKPSVSNGSRGVRILQTEIDEYDLLFNYKPNNLYSSLDKMIAILQGRVFPELLVSEYLPGEEFTIDTIVSGGSPKIILPRSRTKMNGGISVQGTFIKQEEIISYCDKILRTLCLSGPIGLQVKAGVDGRFQLLEINPRIQGTSVAALGIGINLPALCVQQEFAELSMDASAIKWGTSFIRYYQEVFYQR